jgi:3-phytase
VYNIDSPAFWHGDDNRNWIIVTAKEGNCLVVYDAATGDSILEFGSAGSDPGQFLRPNGIFILNDYIYVVERDNHRVQMLTLPEFETVALIGSEHLKKPYGIYAYQDMESNVHLYITDNFENIGNNRDLKRRVHHYSGRGSDWQLVNTFGDTSGTGKLNIVESILGDISHNRIYLAEEDTTQSAIKIYDFEGNFTGKIFGNEIFKNQVEGLALYSCSDKEGFIIATDQSDHENRYHLFDRLTFDYIGSFTGPDTKNTDGIWLTQKSIPGFGSGVFYAIHDDQAVSAFDLGEILAVFKLKKVCP